MHGVGDDWIGGFGSGKFENDILTGGEGADIFVIGDAHKPHYTANQSSYAVITDFKYWEGDKIQTKSGIGNYSLNYNSSAGTISISHQNNLIAVVENVSSRFDVLLSEDFRFVG